MMLKGKFYVAEKSGGCIMLVFLVHEKEGSLHYVFLGIN
jgi:hypothetical protein